MPSNPSGFGVFAIGAADEAPAMEAGPAGLGDGESLVGADAGAAKLDGGKSEAMGADGGAER